MKTDVYLARWNGPRSATRRATWSRICLGLALSTAALLSQPTSGPVASESPPDAAIQAWVPLDGFEDPGWPDPNLWQTLGSSPPSFWPTDCRSKSGSRSLWAFGGRFGDVPQPCGAGAPRGASSTLYQRLDLRGATLASRLELYFELWLQMRPADNAGLFIFLHVPNADESDDVKRVPIFGATGSSGRWAFPTRRLDLLNLADISDPRQVYDLRGSIWRLEWRAQAPEGTEPGGGIFIDDLQLVWEPEPAITPPTQRPPSTPQPLPPTETPTPPATSPSPTARPTLVRVTLSPFEPIHLPLLRLEIPAARSW